MRVMDPREGERRVMMHAVSEVVGAIILISVAALAMGIVILVLFSSPMPTHVPSFSGLISNSSNTIYISHEGGDPLQVGQFKVLVDGQDETTLFTKSLSSDTFSLGMKMNATLSPMPKRVVVVSDTSGGGGSVLLSIDLVGAAEIPPGETASLSIVKTVVNDNGGTKVAGDFSGTINGVTALGGNSWTGTGSPGVEKILTAVGSYNVIETADSAYDTTYSADCSGTISLGETKTCTVTNNDKAAHLIIIKSVIGGTKVASDFSGTISGVTALGGNSWTGTETPGVDMVLTSVGSYEVTETVDNGYSVTYSSGCTGTIALGETKTCTVTNNYVGGICIIGG
jgi:hypothetical protein